MKVIDSSFLVSLFLPEDINHEKAKEIFKKEDLFIVPEDVIKETLTIICYKRGIKYAKEVWKILSKSEVFEIVSEKFEKLISFYMSLNKKISYFDSCVIFFSLIYNSDPISFDKQLNSTWKRIKE